MENGRNGNGVRNSGPPRKRKTVVETDVHGTLVLPVGGKPQALLVKEQAEAVLGKIKESYQSLDRRTRVLRLKLERHLPPEARSGPAYWGFVNSHIYGCQPEAAVEISRRLTTNPALYEMPEDRRKFFTWLFEEMFPADKTTHMIISNSDRASIIALLESIRMMKYFLPENIFTPEAFGGHGKPYLQCFGGPLKAKGIDPKAALMIGNSLFHDLSASLLGIDTLWLKDNDEVATRRMVKQNLGPEAMQFIHIVRRIERAKALVNERFV